MYILSIETLPEIFQNIAYSLPLVYIFEEARSILIDQSYSSTEIIKAFSLNGIYLFLAISLFYYSFNQARKSYFSKYGRIMVRL